APPPGNGPTCRRPRPRANRGAARPSPKQREPVMAAKIDLVLIPGLLCSPALWAAQISTLSDIADITVADHTRHASMPELAEAILAAAPPRFALAGLSMGGYIAYEIIRQAGDRVLRLALLDTGARADPPDRRQGRLELVRLAEQKGAASAQRQLL